MTDRMKGATLRQLKALAENSVYVVHGRPVADRVHYLLSQLRPTGHAPAKVHVIVVTSTMESLMGETRPVVFDHAWFSNVALSMVEQARALLLRQAERRA